MRTQELELRWWEQARGAGPGRVGRVSNEVTKDIPGEGTPGYRDCELVGIPPWTGSGGH